MKAGVSVRRAALVIAFVPCVALAQPAQSKSDSKDASGTYKVDPVHSSNVFRIKHLNTAYFHGRFNELGGAYVLNDADPAKCSFDVHLKTDSIDTNNDDRNKHLKSADFFDAEKHPEISFKSTGVKKTGENQLEVAGNLTLHGVTQPLTVKIERTGAGPGMRGEFRSGWETTFTIQRSDFDMKNMIGPLSDEVRLTVSVEGVRQ